MQCNWSLCSCKRLILPRSSSTMCLLDLSLRNLRPSFRFIRPAADTRQWFTGPSGLWLSTAFLYLPVFLPFVGPFVAPPSFISLPVLLCLFSTVLYFITFSPFLPSLCISSVSSYPWSYGRYICSLVFDRVEKKTCIVYHTCRNWFLNCRHT